MEGKLAYARELILARQINPEDYRLMKADYTSKLEKLESKRTNYPIDAGNINGLIHEGINNLINLDKIYENGCIVQKREALVRCTPKN